MKEKDKLIYLDTETTGAEEEDKLIQIGYRSNSEDVNELFKANLPIKIGAMATHHITEKMVENKPKFKNSPIFQKLLDYNLHEHIMVAHNAPFDDEMLQKEGVKFNRIIDTLKIARHLDPNGKIESYALQYLRYLLGIEIEAVAHDAWGDILVLEAVFERMFNKLKEKESLTDCQTINRMIEISDNPVKIARFQFGKHKGELVQDVAIKDKGYIRWLLGEKKKEPKGEEDWFYTLSLYGFN